MKSELKNLSSECFYRPSLDAPCQLECELSLTGGSIPAPKQGACDGSNATHPKVYEVDVGYELIDEDTCDPNLPASVKPKAVISCGTDDLKLPSKYFLEDWKKLSPPPPIIDLPSKKTALFVFAFIAFLLAIGGGSYYLWKTNDKYAFLKFRKINGEGSTPAFPTLSVLRTKTAI